ncbi:LytR C-terminal domain-containing protein [Brachybacterium sp. MASK1Z-5]|uniref:LytR C-terminal domain-containing protein n=1 Tax=Brachybacterium halotolerans TaxID=2795215 RepID=A0ABS1BCZ3_9MICO|nr:LytR C-terminal domain-containing protein [Brachybacterium halotolerans]
MADSEYPYPPDQFDEEATEVAYHGAHRAEESFWRQNLVYLIIIAVAVVVLLVLLFTIGGLGKSGDDRAEAPTTAASSQDDSSKSDDASDGGGEDQSEPDKSTPVLVMNAGGISGMAGAWEKSLTDAGWTKVGIGTADNVQQESVVFYRDDEDKASAQALADEVGAGDARQSDEYDNRITFVAVEQPEG